MQAVSDDQVVDLEEVQRLARDCAVAMGLSVEGPTISGGAVWLGDGWNLVLDGFGRVVLRRYATQEVGPPLTARASVAYALVQIAQARATEWRKNDG